MGITRKELNEIRRLNDPPKTVLRCLELLYLILKAGSTSSKARPDWETQVLLLLLLLLMVTMLLFLALYAISPTRELPIFALSSSPSRSSSLSQPLSLSHSLAQLPSIAHTRFKKPEILNPHPCTLNLESGEEDNQQARPGRDDCQLRYGEVGR